METRTIEQVKIYRLLLNRMTGRFEDTGMVAIAYDEIKLMEFYNEELVERYKDEDWSKTFRQGGPLEWCNPLDWSDYSGIFTEWTTQESIDNFMSNSFNNVTLVQ
jgi:hypothetical protein